LRAEKLLILALETGMSCRQNYLTRMGWKVINRNEYLWTLMSKVRRHTLAITFVTGF